MIASDAQGSTAPTTKATGANRHAILVDLIGHEKFKEEVPLAALLMKVSNVPNY